MLNLQMKNYLFLVKSKRLIIKFKNSRSINQLKMKWCNEQCPKYSKDFWSQEEDIKLMDLTSEKDQMDWDEVSSKIGSIRSPFQCYERYIYLKEINKERRFKILILFIQLVLFRLWTPEEDQKLLASVREFNVGEQIPWGKGVFICSIYSYSQLELTKIVYCFEILAIASIKILVPLVASFINGRTKFDCEYRYSRSLCTKLKHGIWTVDEDLVRIIIIPNQNGKKKYAVNHTHGSCLCSYLTFIL